MKNQPMKTIMISTYPAFALIAQAGLIHKVSAKVSMTRPAPRLAANNQ